MQTSTTGNGQGPIEAINHPVRRMVLRVFVDNWKAEPERTMTPKEVADRLGLALSNVSYHMRILATSGAIALFGTAPIRGAVQHEYKADGLLHQRWVRDLLKLMEAEDARTAEHLRES